MKNKILVLLLLSILFFIFPTSGKAQKDPSAFIKNTAETNTTYYFIHLADFKVSNPKPVSMEKSGSDNIKKYSTNDDPHFEISADNLKDAESKTYALITGLTIVDLSKVKSLLNNIVGKATTMLLLGLTSTDVDDILKSEKNYFVLPSTYTVYFLTKAAVKDDNAIFLAGMSPIEIKTINSSTDEFDEAIKALDLDVDIKTKAASSYIDPITKTNYSKYLTFKDNKYALISSDEKNNLIKDTKSASGACFTIQPSGTSNNCTNTVASGCSLGTANKTFFLYGMSCSNINSLFTNKNSVATEATNTKTQAALLDKIQVQVQVPFGNVKDGINLAEYINAIYQYLISFALVLAGIMIALGGFQYMMGKGDAKGTIKNAVLGLVLLATSYTILQVVNPNALELKTLEVADLQRDTFELADNLGGPTMPEGGAAEMAAISNKVSPISNKLSGCAAYQPPPNAEGWSLKCIDITSDNTRITDENQMREYALRYLNNTENFNDKIVYFKASSGSTDGYLFSKKPGKLSWNVFGRSYTSYDETQKKDVSNTIKLNARYGDTVYKSAPDYGAVCIPELSYAQTTKEDRANWDELKRKGEIKNCVYQDLIVQRYVSYYQKENGSYSLNKSAGKYIATGHVFMAPYYKQECINIVTKDSPEKLCLSCIGYVNNYWSCIGRPLYFYGATYAVSLGQVISDIKYEGDDVYINGIRLKVGDVVGWPAGDPNDKPEVLKQSRPVIQSVASALGGTVENVGKETILKGAKRTVNGKSVTLDIKFLTVGHVILYIGKGQVLDWGSGLVRSLKGWSNYISHIVFMNDMETSLYNKIQSDPNYKLKTCKDIYDELKKRTDAYFADPAAKKDFYSLPLVTPKDIYNKN